MSACIALAVAASAPAKVSGSPADAPPVVPAAGAAHAAATGARAAPTSGAPSVTAGATCLESGDGYFRARIAGAVDAKIDWPNSGTQCQGESKRAPPGIRLSFQRAGGGKPNLLFVFGLTGIREGQPARATGANLTVILQGTSRIFGTLGDARCTVDSLTQAPLKETGYYRVEARGFCTQPAHAIHGDGDVLVSTFEFAGPVKYDADESMEGATPPGPPVRPPGASSSPPGVTVAPPGANSAPPVERVKATPEH